MTAKELIAILKGLPADLPVYVADWDVDYIGLAIVPAGPGDVRVRDGKIVICPSTENEIVGDQND